MKTDGKFKILFLCTGNSARSVFGEYIMNFLGRGKFEAYSAGADPSGQVNPMTLKVLKDRLRLDASDARSKSWEEFMDQGVQFDFVITVCDNAKESCPVWPGQPVIAHWRAPDPVDFEGTEEEKERYFYQVAMLIRRRIELFISLPFEKLDKLRIQQMAEDIARKTSMEVEPEPAE